MALRPVLPTKAENGALRKAPPLNAPLSSLAGGPQSAASVRRRWLRGVDLNHRPLGYEPNELPGCSTPRNDATKRVWTGQRRGNSARQKKPGWDHRALA